MLLFGVFFVAISVFFIVYSFTTIADNTNLYLQLQQSKVAVVLQDTGFLFYYGGWAVLLSLLLMGFYSLFLAYKGERPRSLDKKITKAMGYSLILGLILMISGKFAAQLYWTNAFEQAGYVECENSFGMTQSWSTKVWVLDSESCRTPFDPYGIWRKQAGIASGVGRSEESENGMQ
ncbi:hypothetical protein GCM10007071_13280 [Marinobacter zhanjiangensis]|uniref:Uncharacterized protein n=2 Tax=Marinobacter zhanjiangensis TaxID=578215 RepID=A0ABQ3AWP6_9GAMM|nr:hypothetical protein GCM10007071_13280 [Marinobacter zhanjiangensis]